MSHIKDLQARIRDLMASGLSKREIARRAGVDHMTIHKLFHDKQRTVNVETYARIMGVVANARA